MKKSVLFAGVMGVLLSFGGAMAEQASAQNPITAASTNTVRKAVYNIQYGAATGTGALDARGYRKGVVPQTNELNNARGTAPATAVANVTVGNLAEVITSDGTKSSAAVDSTHAPTKSIQANTKNVEVLQRDKLVTPAAGNCVSGKPCGYVTTGNDANAPQGTTSNKVWMRITNCTGSGNNIVCD